ncbi:MAG: GNAT family N-acetyltransferase [Gemmatimonadaceae bacterium]
MKQAINIIVRRAVAEDLVAIAPLFDAYRQFYGATANAAGTHAFLEARQARKESTLWVALNPDADEQAVGFAHLYPCFSSVSLAPIVILNDLYVSPEWRRTNVARCLIAAIIEHSAQLGAVRLELATQLSNEPARRLYGSLGFEPDLEFTHLNYALATPAQHAGA